MSLKHARWSGTINGKRSHLVFEKDTGNGSMMLIAACEYQPALCWRSPTELPKCPKCERLALQEIRLLEEQLCRLKIKNP